MIAANANGQFPQPGFHMLQETGGPVTFQPRFLFYLVVSTLVS